MRSEQDVGQSEAGTGSIMEPSGRSPLLWMAFLFVLGLVFIALKVAGYLNWSWLLVLSPFLTVVIPMPVILFIELILFSDD